MSSIGRGAPWLDRQRRDIYVRRAKDGSWRSRAVFKLAEIDQTCKLIRRRCLAVDLGSAPGSWSQYLAQRGASVIACDLKEMAPVKGVNFICGDYSCPTVQASIVKAAGQRGIDLILSDCAPTISGIPDADQNAMAELIVETINFANRHLRPGGSVLIKVLQSPATQALWTQYRSRFATIRAIKPAASRSQSSETYWLVRLNSDR